MDISVVIPVKDEAQSLPILYKQITSVLQKLRKQYEIIFIDDGSRDTSWSVLQSLLKRDTHIQLIRFRANFGKSAALAKGFDTASGNIIITLDADLQDDPKEIPAFVRKLEQGYDFVIGWRQRRHDTFAKRLSSKLFNAGTSLLTNVKLHDFNCGLKAMKKEVAKEISLYGELHRFLPVLAAKRYFSVTELPVTHHARTYGVSKYGFERSWKGIVDLTTTLFLTGFSTKPAHFFSTIGIVLFLLGFALDFYVTILKVLTGTTQGKIPLLLAGILCMVLGVQLISTGLIAEMIVNMQRKKKTMFPTIPIQSSSK